MQNRRSTLLLLFNAAASLALGGSWPVAAAAASIEVHPNPAQAGEIPVLVVQGDWADACIPRLRAMRIEPMAFPPFDVAALLVTLVAGNPGGGCAAVVTPYRLDIPLPLRAEQFLLGLHIFVSVESAEMALPPLQLGEAFLDVRHLPRENLPLHGGLFEVTVEWTDAEGRNGTGKVVPGYSDNSGLFWFFRPHNWELLVKVLNGCLLNGHYWVLGAGATNVGYTLRVEAPAVGPPGQSSWTHVNPIGRHARFFIDIEAIPCAFPGGGN